MSTVLIVDDDSESRETLAILVRLLMPGAETLLGANGQEGVDLALLHRPSAIVLDVEMPLCGGCEAAATIRRALGQAAPLMIGVSGNLSMLEEGLDAGHFDHVLAKPIVIAELIQLLA